MCRNRVDRSNHVGAIARDHGRSATQRFTELVTDGVFDRLQDVVSLRRSRLRAQANTRQARRAADAAADGASNALKQLARDARGDLRAESAGELIFVRDDHAAGLLTNAAIDSQSWEQWSGGRARPSMLPLSRPGARRRASAAPTRPRDHDDVAASRGEGWLFKTAHEVAAWILAPVYLAIQVFVLRNNAGSSQRIAVHRRPAASALRRRTRCAGGTVREDAFAGLAVHGPPPFQDIRQSAPDDDRHE